MNAANPVGRYLSYATATGTLDRCAGCGALVGSRTDHDRWHNVPEASPMSAQEISYEARMELASIEEAVRRATDNGMGADLILVATAAGLLGQPEPGSALGLALTRAFDQHQGNTAAVVGSVHL